MWVCVFIIACVFVCVGMGVWSRHLNMGRSSSIQPRQVSHHSHQHHKKHFTIWCFQCTKRDNIFNWQQNCLNAIYARTSKGRGMRLGLHLCMFLCICAWMCDIVHVCVPAVGSSCLCSGLACCQACPLMMRVQFLKTFPICSLSWEA